jgi:hypothetical protein
MALTIINTPQIIAPVYNPNYFIVDSTNKSQDNFEYLFDVYTSSGGTLIDRLIRVRIPQEPISGYGVYNPMKILQSQIENEFKPNLTGCSSQDYIEYSIIVGEAYTYYWNFQSLFGTAVSGTGCLLNVTLTGNTQHYYSVGDKINISNSSIDAYNGNWEVLQVPNNNQVVLDLCVSSLSSTSGTTKLFNDEQTFFSSISITNEYFAHNAAIDTYDFIDYRIEGFVRDNYYPSISGTSWYTNAPNGYKVRIENRGTMTYFNDIYTGSTYPLPNTLYIETNDGGEFSIPLNCTTNINDVGVLPWNLNNSSNITVISGSLPIIKTTTESYNIRLRNGITTAIRMNYQYSGVTASTQTYYPIGLYNGKNYYSWNDGVNTFYLWYNSGLQVWEVSNALGGGTDYLYSTNSGSTYSPQIGQLGVEYINGGTILFTQFRISSVTAIDLHEPFTFNLYDFCSKYENNEIIFMDKKGSWMPMNFELVSRKNVGVERKTYKQGLEYNYGYLDRGNRVVQNNINYVFTINTNWLTESQSIYFEELLTSPEVYLNYNNSGNFIPINLTTTNQEIKTKKNSRLIQYTLEYTLSNNPIGMI